MSIQDLQPFFFGMLEETAAINVVHEHDMHHRGQIRETPIAFDLREAQSTLSHGAYRHDASCCLREFAHLLLGVGTRSTPSHARLDRERNAAYFTYLRFPESVRRMKFLDQLDRMPQSQLQAHLVHAQSYAFSRLRGISLGLCCQRENRRDVCKTASLFKGVEDQAKRQRKIKQDHKFPSGLGHPKPEGKDEGESYTLFQTLPPDFDGVIVDLCPDRFASIQREINSRTRQ
jgi:hypothetical protein